MTGSLWTRLWTWLTRNWDTTPIPTDPTEPQNPIPQPLPVPTPSMPTLSDFLRYQWQFEGANPLIRNPGNYRFFYGGYLPVYGNVTRSPGGFAVFSTIEQGQLYSTNSTKNVIKHHPELSILTYIGGDGDWSGYAPASDHNPVLAYATYISSRLGVANSFLMKSLVS